MIRRPPRSTLFPYTTLLPISSSTQKPPLVNLRTLLHSRAVPTEVGDYFAGKAPADTQRLRFQKASLVNLRTHSAFARCRLNSDRKSTRLNSSHLVISYAVFCL